jgi:hypothetical protein
VPYQLLSTEQNRWPRFLATFMLAQRCKPQFDRTALASRSASEGVLCNPQTVTGRVTIIGESEAIATSNTVLKLASSFSEYATSRLLIVITLSNRYVLVRERGETIRQLLKNYGFRLVVELLISSYSVAFARYC